MPRTARDVVDAGPGDCVPGPEPAVPPVPGAPAQTSANRIPAAGAGGSVRPGSRLVLRKSVGINPCERLGW